ncbi:MAG: rod shape-determining protein MreC [Actinomycetota bacterium]|nr:rod shape-determining protein MreC [Actinomycetota bacterium]
MLNHRTRIILAVLVIIALTFTILDLRGGKGPFASVRSVVSSALGGVQVAASVIVSPIMGVGSWWGTWGDQRTRIAELESQNASLQDTLIRSAEDRARADALDQLLRVAGVGRYRIVPAEVIAVEPAQDFTWTVTIDAGRDDGLLADMTVINGQGLIGRILSTTKTTATVVLIVDASSAVGARVAGTEEIGILSGTGRQDSLEFQTLDPLAALKSGQALLTFGSRSGRPYAPGIPIGEVVDVSGTAGQLTRIATIRPFADVSTLTVVGVVIRPPREDPRDSVLPTPPEKADSANVDAPAPTGVEDGASPAPTASAKPKKETAAKPVPAPTPSAGVATDAGGN